jgi:class 3 adenylate cyclase
VTLDETLLDDKLAELERAANWSPRVVSKLENLLRSEDPWALFRINPYRFAAQRGVSTDEAVDLFLLATKAGLFQMNWHLLCPGCGDAIESLSTLQSVCANYHCCLCSSTVETRLDDFVQVSFTVSPRLRQIPAHQPETLPIDDYYFKYRFTRETRSPGGGPYFDELLKQMHRGRASVAPRKTERFELSLEAGEFALYDAQHGRVVAFHAEASRPGPNPIQHMCLSEGRPGREPTKVAVGELVVELENDSDERSLLLFVHKPQSILDDAAELIRTGQSTNMDFDPFLSGRRLLTSETFRRVFGSEVIRSAEGIGVRDVTILFTDLKGSTAMYDRIGDLKAFALVNQHFDRLAKAIKKSRGAIVKTIGDAVMASFETPADAVRAAREMLTEIESFNEEVGEREIVLKVGVHRGASIAVTLNERLDFFGQTVNIAARVQGLADAEEIYLTEDVYRAPGVRELLEGLDVSPRKAQLKGVQRAVDVYRVGLGPDSQTDPVVREAD